MKWSKNWVKFGSWLFLAIVPHFSYDNWQLALIKCKIRCWFKVRWKKQNKKFWGEALRRMEAICWFTSCGICADLNWTSKPINLKYFVCVCITKTWNLGNLKRQLKTIFFLAAIMWSETPLEMHAQASI